MDDLATGMQLKGTVRNVVDFGAFVDIGVKQDGLLHRSQIPAGQSLKVGDVIVVEILKIEPERGRIGLGWPGKKLTARTLKTQMISSFHKTPGALGGLAVKLFLIKSSGS